MVSACVIAYNHEKYITQALEGAQAQQLTYPYEIVVGDDKSPDNTLSIANDIAASDSRIKVLEREKNLGMHENWRATIAACKGEYIALIEADDYWTDSRKLQKQVDLLESKPEMAVCFHYSDVVFENSDQKNSPLQNRLDKKEFTIEDVILRPWFIPTASIVFRKSMLRDLSWTNGLSSIDIPLLLTLADNGNLELIEEQMGAYRIHPMGVSEQTWGKRQKVFEFSANLLFQGFNKVSKGKYQTLINRRLANNYLALLEKNSVLSSAYIKAMRGYKAADPTGFSEWLKAQIITKLIPSPLYRIYGKLTHRK